MNYSLLTSFKPDLLYNHLQNPHTILRNPKIRTQCSSISILNYVIHNPYILAICGWKPN